MFDILHGQAVPSLLREGEGAFNYTNKYAAAAALRIAGDNEVVEAS